MDQQELEVLNNIKKALNDIVSLLTTITILLLIAVVIYGLSSINRGFS